ncbi:hypothetical protein OG372_00125 [Streptomyces sp. NBC_01020]|uniref:hypothetical protein n=1 Tax=unclassified Streptomyces TaxID=2593676 RepID=UPI002258AE03|nr:MULTISPECIES: hypothetical protein [unclassified Streptomyces]MCX4729349.1 hypothetical protein [Streptomyces sp. NBC_01306]WSV02127.1 hypothetical protein OG372_00125 [Streptomyces sp. NBC_01020]WSX65146.1 hypothetical protein OG221_00135 [Streptomyces sp. NBC_00932]
MYDAEARLVPPSSEHHEGRQHHSPQGRRVGACKKTLGPTHKCSNLVSKVVYYTESILQVEYKGQHASKILHSKKETVYCG